MTETEPTVMRTDRHESRRSNARPVAVARPPDIKLAASGVEYDVLGIGYDDFGAGPRAGITALGPGPHFKRGCSDPVGRLSTMEA